VDHFHLKQMMMKTLMEVHSMNNWMIKAGHYDKKTQDLFLKETKHFNKYRTVVPWGTKDSQQATQTQTTQHLLYTPKDPEYKAITLGHYLSRKYQNLLLMSEDKLTINQRHRLNQILHEFDPRGYLKEAYCAKELFFESLKTKDTTLLTKAIEDMITSLQYKIETCGKTLQKWKQCIINFFTTNITNAFTEGKNTKIKLLKRMAYGYRIKENFQKRLLLCL
jgi:transposase